MVGLVYSQSDMISRDVFLVESVGVVATAMEEEAAEDAAFRAQPRGGAGSTTRRRALISRSEQVGINEQNMQHLTAVVFVQPNSYNLDRLRVLLKSPRYKDYHICAFFSFE
jgi:hypothetical protein